MVRIESFKKFLLQIRKLLGIDGCPAGWIAAFANGETFHYHVYAQFQDIVADHSDLKLALIDIPIGLTQKTFNRTIDQLLRNLLPKERKSSVFTAPCKNAVYANDYESAKRINLHETGKSISIQAWNICHKIKEVDQCLNEYPSVRNIFFESHPELCFLKLNNFQLIESKHSPKGRQQRIEIIKKKNHRLLDVYQRILKETKRSMVKADDILDALVLLLINIEGNKESFDEIQNIDHYKGEKLKFYY